MAMAGPRFYALHPHTRESSAEHSFSSPPPSRDNDPFVYRTHDDREKWARSDFSGFRFGDEYTGRQTQTVNLQRRNGDDDDDVDDECNDTRTLDRFLDKWRNTRLFFRGIVLSAVFTIPFLSFYLVARLLFPKKTLPGSGAARATVFELAKWLLISWAVFAGLLWLGKGAAILAKSLCKGSRFLVRYKDVANAMCMRMVLIVWAVICYAVLPKIFHHSFSAKDENWVRTLQKVFKFLIVAFVILFVQGFCLELASVRYVQGYTGPRAQNASRYLKAFEQLYEATHPIRHAKEPFIMRLKWWIVKRDKTPFEKLKSSAERVEAYCELNTLVESFTKSIWEGLTSGSPRGAITKEEICSILPRRANRKPPRWFHLLDTSKDGQVTYDELEELITRVCLMYKQQGQARKGIASLLSQLEVILTVVMLGIIFVVWALFFGGVSTTKFQALWSGLTGLGFAIGGVLTEFVNACTFVFGKHPYDVGDHIEAKGKTLIVKDIHLTYSNFEEVRVTDLNKPGSVVQISHASLIAETITNWTRSDDQIRVEHEKKVLNDKDGATIKENEEKLARQTKQELLALKIKKLQ